MFNINLNLDSRDPAQRGELVRAPPDKAQEAIGVCRIRSPPRASGDLPLGAADGRAAASKSSPLRGHSVEHVRVNMLA